MLFYILVYQRLQGELSLGDGLGPWEMAWGSWEGTPKEGSVGFEYHLLLEASELPCIPSPSASAHTCLLGHLLLCFLFKDHMFAFGLDRDLGE